MDADVNDVFTIWYAGCENNNGGTLTATSVPKGTKIPLRNPQLGKYRKAAKTKSVFPSDQSLKKRCIWPVKISRKNGHGDAVDGIRC